MPRKSARCVKCGVEVEQLPGPGAPRLHCPAHRPRENRSRDIQRAAGRGEDTTALAVGTGAIADPKVRAQGTVRRLAMALATSRGDERLALEKAGLDPESEEARQTLEEARERYGDLLDGRPGSVPSLINEFALEALAKTDDPTMSGPQAANAFASIAKAADIYTGAAGKLYTHVAIVIPGLGDHCTECGAVMGVGPAENCPTDAQTNTSPRASNKRHTGKTPGNGT